MESILHKALIELGCSLREIKFYSALIQLGSSPIAAIATKARLSRSTAYLLAQQLAEKGLITHDHKQYKKFLVAVEPSVILRQLEAKRRRVGRSSIALKDNLEAIQSLYQKNNITPKVKTFQGAQGLSAIRNDIMRTQSEIHLWTNQATERYVFAENQRNAFISERVKRNISIRVLAVDNNEGNSLFLHDTELKRTTRILPKDMTFSPETYLYDNKIAVLDYDTEIFGIIIENRLIHQAQKAMFEAMWKISSERPNMR